MWYSQGGGRFGRASYMYCIYVWLGENDLYASVTAIMHEYCLVYRLCDETFVLCANFGNYFFYFITIVIRFINTMELEIPPNSNLLTLSLPIFLWGQVRQYLSCCEILITDVLLTMNIITYKNKLILVHVHTSTYVSVDKITLFISLAYL